MKILVTGGAGFIGQHLCRSLWEDGHDVTCLDNLSTSSKAIETNDRLTFWRHDVCDPWHIEVDRIYHLACPASPVQYQRNPVRTIKTAVLGTLNALELARNTGARLLIASTSEVYGDPQVHPQPETYYGNVNPIGDRACYDEGKRVGESLAASWFRQYRTDVRITRIFNTYGPGMSLSDGRLIPNLVVQARNRKPLTVYGSGHQTRSWCYVSDTVRGLKAVMNSAFLSDSIPVFNIGNPDERTILEIASLIIKWFGDHSGITPWIEHRELPQDDPKQRCPDISSITTLGWAPEISLDVGIGRTLKWFMEQPT